MSNTHMYISIRFASRMHLITYADVMSRGHSLCVSDMSRKQNLFFPLAFPSLDPKPHGAKQPHLCSYWNSWGSGWTSMSWSGVGRVRGWTSHGRKRGSFS